MQEGCEWGKWLAPGCLHFEWASQAVLLGFEGSSMRQESVLLVDSWGEKLPHQSAGQVHLHQLHALCLSQQPSGLLCFFAGKLLDLLCSHSQVHGQTASAWHRRHRLQNFSQVNAVSNKMVHVAGS